MINGEQRKYWLVVIAIEDAVLVALISIDMVPVTPPPPSFKLPQFCFIYLCSYQESSAQTLNISVKHRMTDSNCSSFDFHKSTCS